MKNYTHYLVLAASLLVGVLLVCPVNAQDVDSQSVLVASVEAAPVVVQYAYVPVTLARRGFSPACAFQAIVAYQKCAAHQSYRRVRNRLGR